MNANLPVRNSVPLVRINRTYFQLFAGLFLFFLTFANHANGQSSNQVTLKINDPDFICGTQTVDLTLPAITAGSDPGLTYSYWVDEDNLIALANPKAVGPGVYYIKGKRSSPFGVASLSVTVTAAPIPTVTIIQPSCTIAKGTITVNSPLGIGMTYSINGVTYTNTTGIFESVGTGTYNVTAKNAAGCISGIKIVSVITEISTPATPGAISGTMTQCPGATGQIYSITAVPNAITYTWLVPVGWTITAGAGTTSITVTAGAAGQNGNISVTAGSSCGTSSPRISPVTVSLASVGGIVSGGSTACISSTSGILILSGHTGNVIKWQSSVSPFTAWIDIANTATTYTSGALIQTTQFRAVVQSGSCSTANSTFVTVTISPATVGGTVSGGTTICSGSISGVLTLSGHTGTVVKWQSAVSPFTTWVDIANTTATYTSGALTQTTQFRAVVQSGSCAIANSGTTTVSMSPPSIGGTTSGGTTICTGSMSGVLTLAGHSGTIVKWQSSVSPFSVWTDIPNTTTTYTSGVLTQTTQFRAVVQNGSCATANSSIVTVTISPATVGGTISGGTTICSGNTSGILTLSGHTGNVVKWQSSVSPFSTWTDIANIATTYTSVSLTQTTQFRAVVQSGNCVSENSAVTIVTVDPISVGGIVTGGSLICTSSTSGLLTLSGQTGAVVKWQSSLSPFTTWTDIVNTATTYTSGVISQTTQFRAVVQNGSCAAANSASTTVTVSLSVTITGVNPSKAGESDGKIDVVMTGGTLPFVYSWTGPGTFVANTEDLSGLKFGTYNILVTDNIGCSTIGSFVLDDPPAANDDNATTIDDIPVTINAVLNDTDADGTIAPSTVDLDPVTAGLQTSYTVTGKGVFSTLPTGEVVFKPVLNYFGLVEIQYVVSDNKGVVSNSAKISVTVISSNLPPVAIDDNYTVAEHNQATGDLFLNDVDPEGKTLALVSFTIGSTIYSPGTLATIPDVGTILINLNGSFIFIPQDHYYGIVPQISYKVVDVGGLSATANLNITVTPVNDAPVTVADTLQAKENTKLAGNISDHYYDIEGDILALNIIPVLVPAHGTLVLSANGDFTYQPFIDFIGSDSFNYQVCDNGIPSQCSVATVTIVIGKDENCEVFVPNVFTPNADGIHDYFKIRCLYNYENPELQIFNRNGNLIFKKDHYGNLDFWGGEEQAFWNGRSENKYNLMNNELPVGTYYYLLKLGDGKALNGFVFLGK